MNGKRAKQIRRLVYGENFSPRFRKYSRTKTGSIVADEKRQRYQQIKKNIKEWLATLKGA